MKLMKGSKEIAKLVDTDNGFVLVRNSSTDINMLPIDLFFTGVGLSRLSDVVSYERFCKWLEDRVTPDNQDEKDLERILKYYGMDRYNAFELAHHTKGVLTCIDEFWVDFEDSPTSGENPIKW